MLVHSFSPAGSWFDDFSAFAGLYGLSMTKDQITCARDLGDVQLHLGWVSDTPRGLDPRPPLGPRFDRAFALARELHSSQIRKGTKIPYVSHLLGVASLVLEDGGDEDQAIAALLHDAVEDQGGQPLLRRIRQ
ncbi:MAG TPA: HD domain-containing protein, partial [Vicinamibacterales bacterium]|nr:HD domain-containing protein [Vicinamibacterales bacterium]